MPVLEPVLSEAPSTWKNLPEPHIDKRYCSRCYVTLFCYPCSEALLIVVPVIIFVVVVVLILLQCVKISILRDLGNWTPRSLVKEEMPSLEMKPLATSHKTWGQEKMSMTDSLFLLFSLSLIFFLTKWKRKKKMPSSRNCCTPLFLIFHMRGFYLSTGGSRKAGFLLSRCINTFSPTTCSLINCNYFRSQDNPGFWKQIHQMLFKVKTQARYRTNEREVFTACVTFPCKCLQTTETDIKE